MGEVWLATELRLGRRVALKLLPADLTRDADRIQRFEQEARAASALNHPNVCTIHALGETGEGQHYIAMEYVEGDTLRRRLATSRLLCARRSISPFRWRRRSALPTRPGSFTATSSQRTSCSVLTAS